MATLIRDEQITTIDAAKIQGTHTNFTSVGIDDNASTLKLTLTNTLATVDSNLTVTGNLTVGGTTTSVNTEEILLADNMITLNSNFTTGTPSENSGIEVSRGSSPNAMLYWDESNDEWVMSSDGGTTTSTVLTDGNFTGVVNDSTVTLTAGTDLTTGGSFTTNQSAPSTITFNHANTTRTDTTSSQSPANGGTFTAISSVTTNARGHVTAANVKTVTLPTYASSDFSHDSLTGFVANEHIDHSTVSITAGNGLTGGGTIAASRTINVASHAGTAGSIGTLNIAANTVGVNLGTTSTTAAAGNHTHTNFITNNAADVMDGGGTAQVLALNSTGNTYLALQKSGTRYAYIQTTGTDMLINSEGTGNMRFYTNGAEDMRLTAAGALHVDGDITAFSTAISDERLKEDVQVVEKPLDILNAVRGVTYTRKVDGNKSAGVIAQELEKVFDCAVREKTLPLHTGDEETLYKTVEYDALHAVLIEAVKELSARVEELESKLK